MEKINNLVSTYQDELKDLRRKNKAQKIQREIELTEQFVEELIEINEIHENIIKTLIGGSL
jgi:wobble nucleotide-excising tRNase